MKVYAKLIKARNMLRKLELKKSGHNKFAGYQYFELGDFLPYVQSIFEHVGLCDIISFTEDVATMTVYDVEDGSSVVFTSPMGSAQLKGCHMVQNIGAVETYQRRYLYVSALAISEHDALDSTTGNIEPVKPTVLPKVKEIEYGVVENELKIKINNVPPKEPNKPIEGDRGEFQIRVSPVPEGDATEWLDMVKTASHLLLDVCTSDADVMTIFKKNKVLFDTVKATDPSFFKEMMGKFTQTKANFAKE